jgi:hypothetical protein
VEEHSLIALFAGHTSFVEKKSKIQRKKRREKDVFSCNKNNDAIYVFILLV